jgi:hypothetical protein
MHKGIKMLMAAGLVLLSLGSCQKEDYKIQSNPDEFAVFPLAIPVAAEGGEYTVNITGHENWTISYGEANTTNTDWVTLSQTSGSGAAVTFSSGFSSTGSSFTGAAGFFGITGLPIGGFGLAPSFGTTGTALILGLFPPDLSPEEVPLIILIDLVSLSAA